MARYGIKCCFNCEKRQLYCHSTCEDYKKERAEMDETNEGMRKQKDLELGIRGQLIDSMDRNNKRTHYRNKRGMR